jgi:hypothetical protein
MQVVSLSMIQAKEDRWEITTSQISCEVAREPCNTLVKRLKYIKKYLDAKSWLGMKNLLQSNKFSATGRIYLV